MSPWRLFKPSTLGEDMDWRMATNRTPKCAEIVCPIPWAWLPQRLGLDEDAASSFICLSQMDNFCFRVQIINEMAFVYEPFSLDCSSASLILDWGALEENLTTARYIASKMKGHPFFHTFILPTKKDVWYYIGAQAWTLTRLFPIWKTLGDRVSALRCSVRLAINLSKSKQKVVSRLEVRCCQKLSTQDICQMLDDRVLAQFCVEVSSTSLLAHSQAFGEKLDYRKST
ncbi:hypothetical protein ID866_2559 [Astraeus odoratus]|nr:hypothetical protein ID866_2559 [Astraeus odoratus]